MSDTPSQPPAEDPLQGLFKGLQGLVQSVAKATEAGANKVRQGVFPSGTGLQGIYGFTIRADLARPSITIDIGQVPQTEAVSPRIEQIDESTHLRLVADMPGVGPEDVKLSVTGSTVLLSAERGSRRYRREIALPFVPAEGAVSHSCSEGVVDIIIQKPGS